MQLASIETIYQRCSQDRLMKNTAENLVYVPLEQWWDSLLEEMADEYLDEAHNHPWIVGFSGGKDSTLVAHAAFEMLSRLRP
ncbi:TPA: hypothetical protein L3698_005956, partial [Pseudomonas aeruginosa]|nr:hypothetical protein [Pseudomonas aeruginosa]